MKIIVAFILVAIIFAPSTVFGWKSINQAENNCIVDCNYTYGSFDSSKSTTFLMIGMISLLGIGLFIKYKKLDKYETFSITCKTCRRNTRGLKCPICEAEQRAVFGS